MIRRVYDDATRRCVVMRWDNSDADIAELDNIGVSYTIVEGDLMLRSVDEVDGRIVTHGLLVEIGEMVTFTPLGWMPYEAKHEEMFRARGVGA